jgi:hypothetical protein
MQLTGRAIAVVGATAVTAAAITWVRLLADDDAGPREIILIPVHDTYVSEAEPEDSYGTARQLRADGAPDVVRSYLRFQVPPLDAQLVSVRLRLHANAPDPSGLLVAPVIGGTWMENVTWRTAPPVGEPVARGHAAAAAEWVEIDVSMLVTVAGPVDLALVSGGNTMVNYSSREAGDATAPQLKLLINGRS